MDNVDAQVLKRADDWLRGGHRAVLGTIVRTWGSRLGRWARWW